MESYEEYLITPLDDVCSLLSIRLNAVFSSSSLETAVQRVAWLARLKVSVAEDILVELQD